jgi:hypothetical protein
MKGSKHQEKYRTRRYGYTRNVAVKGLIKTIFIVKQHNILYDLYFSVTYYDIVHNNTWYVNEVSINENHTFLTTWSDPNKFCLLRIRLIGSFIRWYGRTVDLSRVIEMLCLFTSWVQRKENPTIFYFYLQENELSCKYICV